MSEWLDKKYINLISISLKNFKWKSPSLANASCPLCGDSHTDKHKARLYFFEKKGSFMIFCHNCGASMSFKNFLRMINVPLFDEYQRESFMESPLGKEIKKKKDELSVFELPIFLRPDSIFKNIKRISQLSVDHPAKKYIEYRRIPSNQHYKLLYAPKFKTWVNSIIPGKFENTDYDDARLIIPFLNEEGEVFAFQGRAFDKKEPKYYTIILNKIKPKIYGFDTIDFNREYFILEGPLDSLFINNALAMAGSDFQVDCVNLPNINTNAVIIYDNEPRNKEIVYKIEKAINRDLKVVIWPNDIKFKDVNEMIMNEMSEFDVRMLIKQNIFSGLEAKLKFNSWRKV